MARRSTGRRSRIVAGSDISTIKTGPLRAVINAQGPALALLKARPRQRVLKESLQMTGDDWLVHWLPRRFTGYAMKLGYPTNRIGFHVAKQQPSKTPITGPLRKNSPLVQTGEFGSKAIDESTARAMFGKDPRIVIKIPMAHPLTTRDKAMMSRIPAREVRWLAKRFEMHLLKQLGAAASDPSSVRVSARKAA